MSSTFFTTGDGDVILRAGQDPSLKHDFRVHKLILSLASPVFKDMFTFPQSPNQNQIGPSDIPIVDLPDSPQTIDTILRFIYPGVESPTFTDLSALSDLLAATDKYNIASMGPVLRNALGSFIETQPFRVYIIACHVGFLEEAKAAARMTTSNSIILPENHEKDVRYISGVGLYRLLWLCLERETTVESELRKLALPLADDYLLPCLEDHWENCGDFYGKLVQGVRTVLRTNPCAGFCDFMATLNSLPDPPPACPGSEDDYSGIMCPFRLSFITIRLGSLAAKLEEVDGKLLKRAFEKEF